MAVGLLVMKGCSCTYDNVFHADPAPDELFSVIADSSEISKETKAVIVNALEENGGLSTAEVLELVERMRYKELATNSKTLPGFTKLKESAGGKG